MKRNVMNSSAATIHRILGEAIASIDSLKAEACAQQVYQLYVSLSAADRLTFLRVLASDYGVDTNGIVQLSQLISTTQDRSSANFVKLQERLRLALLPRYQQLFIQIGRLKGGVKLLVDIRAEVLQMLTTNGFDAEHHPQLRSLYGSLKDLLSMWLSVSSLKIEKVLRSSSPELLHKISEYEAVHPIKSEVDLRWRLGSYRRCYVFTHMCLPDEPIVVLHTALTNEISSNIQAIVEPVQQNGHKSESENPSNINTAIFYSITSTQKGLQGIEHGNNIIKQAVSALRTEFPHMHQFASLSPIPGFKDWLIDLMNKQKHMEEVAEHPSTVLFSKTELSQFSQCIPKSMSQTIFEDLRKCLLDNSWLMLKGIPELLKEPLIRLCVKYLYIEKRRGYPINPVANFHLKNGAVLWRLNWLGDNSRRGLNASCGIMANYCYFVNPIEILEENSKKYMQDKKIEVSEEILHYVEQIRAIDVEYEEQKQTFCTL
ncbi:malonyl-CoA decarboxylase, mitochondrial-like [Tubulanus polymorphus]|uniref:malonyl-CoA decarboxylase, mitochondrial-like n=1 Tax=Tubulanus polymorphus TaxID=672921 RepID=UPI003DA6A6DA